MPSLGRQIRAARLSRRPRMTQKELSKQAGIGDDSFVSRLERDKIPNPGHYKVLRILKVLGLTEEVWDDAGDMEEGADGILTQCDAETLAQMLGIPKEELPVVLEFVRDKRRYLRKRRE